MSGLIESDPYGLRMSMMPLHKLPEEILEYIIDIVKSTGRWATTIQRMYRGYAVREGQLVSRDVLDFRVARAAQDRQLLFTPPSNARTLPRRAFGTRFALSPSNPFGARSVIY